MQSSIKQQFESYRVSQTACKIFSVSGACARESGWPGQQINVLFSKHQTTMGGGSHSPGVRGRPRWRQTRTSPLSQSHGQINGHLFIVGMRTMWIGEATFMHLAFVWLHLASIRLVFGTQGATCCWSGLIVYSHSHQKMKINTATTIHFISSQKSMWQI